MQAKNTSALLATAVAAMLAGAPLAGCRSQSSHAQGAAMEKHACATHNSCKGMGGCKTGDNGCAGKNSCKGKGGCATDKHSCKGSNSCKSNNACKG
jgi:hypothetical protein